jgi:hypothetical protein
MVCFLDSSFSHSGFGLAADPDNGLALVNYVSTSRLGFGLVSIFRHRFWFGFYKQFLRQRVWVRIPIHDNGWVCVHISKLRFGLISHI